MLYRAQFLNLHSKLLLLYKQPDCVWVLPSRCDQVWNCYPRLNLPDLAFFASSSLVLASLSTWLTMLGRSQ